MPTVFSTGEVARRFGKQRSHIRELFDSGLLNRDEYGRVGRNIVVRVDQIPEVAAALAKKGWLSQPFCTEA